MSNRTITTNRKAYYEYAIEEKIEAGLVLRGTEIKSIRAGRVNLRDAFARPDKGEMWLYGVHIALYPQAGAENHEPYRPRKLLLHRDELGRLATKATQKGFTLVPLSLYIKNHHAKVELGLGRGKRKFDKRRVAAKREADREIQRAIRWRGTIDARRR